MGMGRFKRLSKEKPVGPAAHPPAAAPTKDEVSEINDLIKATKGGESTSPLRERRRTTGTVSDPSKLPRDQEINKTQSVEAAAINDFIKQNKSDGGKSLRERRRSKEHMPGEKTPPSSRRDSIDKVHFAPFALEQVDRNQQKELETKALEKVDTSAQLEAKAINQRITEDRRVRRASKELVDAEKTAHAKMSAMNREVAAAEAEAEKQWLEHGAALSGAQARGAAKAAAMRAGGIFVPTTEYAALQDELKELKKQVIKLREEKKASQSLFAKLAAKFQSATDVDAVLNSSPEQSRFTSPSSKPNVRRRRNSDSGAGLMRKMVESPEGTASPSNSFSNKDGRARSPGTSSPSNSFVNRVRRSMSPGSKRATSPGGRRSPSNLFKQQKSTHFAMEDDGSIPTGHVIARPPPPTGAVLTVV